MARWLARMLCWFGCHDPGPRGVCVECGHVDRIERK
jgi:hypothetical protein